MDQKTWGIVLVVVGFIFLAMALIMYKSETHKHAKVSDSFDTAAPAPTHEVPIALFILGLIMLFIGFILIASDRAEVDEAEPAVTTTKVETVTPPTQSSTVTTSVPQYIPHPIAGYQAYSGPYVQTPVFQAPNTAVELTNFTAHGPQYSVPAVQFATQTAQPTAVYRADPQFVTHPTAVYRADPQFVTQTAQPTAYRTDPQFVTQTAQPASYQAAGGQYLRQAPGDYTVTRSAPRNFANQRYQNVDTGLSYYPRSV